MKIDLLCNDGSPLEVSEKSISGEDGRMGVGGAELFLLTICRAWHEAGHEVTLYNSPKYPNSSVFNQLPVYAFVPEDERDVVIVWRSPNDRLTPDTVGLKVWVSCDQHTKGDFGKFAQKVDKIVTISERHADYFRDIYGIQDTITIDIPIRIWEYEENEVEKVPYRCIFNHMPDRGVMQLHAAWAEIVRDVPEASLVITSDWRLWSEWADPTATQQFKTTFARLPGVTYLGAVKRDELIRHQLEAQLELYPSIYDELFGIATAENQVAGCYPITSDVGATRTTNMGTVVAGNVYSPEWNREFVDTVVATLRNQDKLKENAMQVQKLAKERFALDRILEIWNDKVFNIHYK